MKIIHEYSHLGGSEILRMRYPKYEQEIYDVVDFVKARRTKVSKEKTKKGRELYSPIDMNKQFEMAFMEREYK